MTPEQFQEFASLLSEAFLLLSGKGQILAANAAAAKLLGLDNQAPPRKTLFDLTTDSPEKLKNYLRLCSRSRQKSIGSLNLCRADGQVQKVRAEGALIRPWSSEAPAQILLRLRLDDPVSSRFLELNKRIDQLAKEIRQRQQAEQEREEMLRREQAARREAETANRLKDEFLATVSHELRTPLNAILGWARLLRSGSIKDQTATRALETIERNAKIQTQLIDDILDVSRIITGKLRLDVTPVHLSSLVEATLEGLRPAAESKQVRLQVVLDPNAGPVAGDPGRLQQVIWNLLSNAIKFTPRKGRVQIRLEQVNSQVKLTISDTGMGIDPAFLPYIFDRFQQADGSITRHHGGLGLGLAIVRHLVDLHGGTVEAQSPGQGQGATFVVTLPVIIVHDTGKPGSENYRLASQLVEESEPLDCPPALAGLKLLVVDDVVDAQVLLLSTLEICGAEVKAVSSAAEAFEALREWQPDLLISDIEMPDEDGYTLIRRVRQSKLDEFRQVPAIALTAHARVEDRVRALGAGFQSHVTKPVDPAELVAVIASLIKSAKPGFNRLEDY